MAEPTLQQVFGAGAVRLASAAAAPSSGLFIPDSALITTGLTAPSTGTAEGHFVAIVKNAQSYLSQSNFDLNAEQSLIIANGYPGFTTKGTDPTQLRQNQLTLSLAKIDNDSTINPSDY